MAARHGLWREQRDQANRPTQDYRSSGNPHHSPTEENNLAEQQPSGCENAGPTNPSLFDLLPDPDFDLDLEAAAGSYERTPRVRWTASDLAPVPDSQHPRADDDPGPAGRQEDLHHRPLHQPPWARPDLHPGPARRPGDSPARRGGQGPGGTGIVPPVHHRLLPHPPGRPHRGAEKGHPSPRPD